MKTKFFADLLTVSFAVGFAGVETRAQATEGAMPVEVGVVRVDTDLYARGEDWRTPAGGSRSRAEAWGTVQMATGITERVEVRTAWGPTGGRPRAG